ncbi:MAG: molecular chaperone DnaK [Bacteroidota bacterium]
MAKISININSGKVEKQPEQPEIIVGIDLGTTNSLVAFMNEGTPKAVAAKDGKNTLVPSIIHFQSNGGILVGDEAKSFLIEDPANTTYSIKRLMGKSYQDVEDFQNYFGYKVIDEDTESLVKIKVGERFFTPIELSARILSQLKARIEAVLEQSISKAVITVPAYFNDAQRQATRDAGKLAGLDVLRIVNEPTAASLAYGIGLDPEKSETIAVYDLGGGTFDISILQIQQGIFEVLSTNGDTLLGGDDFDRAIIDFWVKKYGLDEPALLADKGQSQALRLLAEQAKKTLSSQEQFQGNWQDQSFEISRTEFESSVQPLIQRTLDSCKMALNDADLETSAVDHVVMVGGSTRMPAVKSAVAAFFDKPVYDKLDPDEVVALGAAIQADILAGNNKDFLLIDVTPLSLGIETVGGLMDTIIPRNSKVPIRAGRQYTTSVDGQVRLKIAVFQGERDLVASNRKLGEFVLEGIPPMAAGMPKIEIHFILDADGILTVRAKELRSGVEQSIKVRSQYGISEEDMAKMLIDSIQNAESDMHTRALLEARNEGQSIVLAADKFLQQNKDLLTEEETKKIIELASELKAKVESGTKDEINQAMEVLNEYTKPLAHKALDHNIQKSLSGKKIGE